VLAGRPLSALRLLLSNKEPAIIYLDSHESVEFELALSQCVDVERYQLNPDKPDLYWIDSAGRQRGWENKQSGELLGSLDSVEEQLTRELEGVDYLGLTVRGIITPTQDGYCQIWQKAKNNPRIYVADQVYRTHYKSYAAWTSRCEANGIVVKEAADLAGLVLQVVAEYENSMKDDSAHHTFNRIIVLKQQVNEWDMDKRRVALQIMGCVPGVGKEIALALSDHFPSLKTLMDTLESGAEKEVAAIPLRLKEGVRGRTIGASAVSAMKKALGI